jgi:hypothetical protein
MQTIKLFNIGKYRNKQRNSSKLFHVREVRRVTHSLDHLVSVLNVLVKVLHPRVEDVRQAVLAQILHTHYAVGLRKLVLLIQP